MFFDFSGSFYVEREDIELMIRKVRDGANSNEVFEDWRAGLDDADYYVVDYVRDQIMGVITSN